MIKREMKIPEAPVVHGGNSLMVVISDLMPDDLMATTQLWQWKAERKELKCEPLVIFCPEVTEHDLGTILQTKYLMAGLMLGVQRLYTLVSTDVAASKGSQRK